MKKAISAGAVALVSAGAIAGCSGGTTTIREIPEAAASSGQSASSPASAGPTSAAVTPAEPPASAASPTGQAAGQGGQAGQGGPAAAMSYCGSPADQGGISVNADTSCPFAENVESAWESSGGAGSVTAYSPVTGLTYTMSCTASGTGYEVCTGGDNAYVEFPASTAAPAPASGQFDDPCTQCAVSTLSQSVADEQQAALEAAPSYDYDTTDNASVNVALTPLGDNTYSATATDSDGDTGSGDTITVSPDGSSWSDTGMTWTGPDVSGGAAGSWTTPAVSDYS
jgi:hypothetical protein